MLKQSMETLQDTRKLQGIGNSPFERERLHLFDQKSLNKRAAGGAAETKVR